MPKKIAEKIQNEVGADTVRIETVRKYEGSYNDIVEQGKHEIDSGYMPEIKPLNVNLDDYDTVILGSPVWWYTFAPAMHTFLNSTDLSGKNIYCFATNGGWVGHTFKDFKEICGYVDIHKGLNIRFSNDKLVTAEVEIEKWIKDIRY